MAPPFTFGIELEFAVACNITSAQKANGTPRSDGRVLEFVPLKQDYIDAEDAILAGIRTNEVGISADSRIAIRKIAHQVAIQRHIKRTLRKAGIPVARKKDSLYYKPNPAEWEIKTDESVKGPENSEHAWVDIEAVSCIYEFNTQNVAEAKEVCNLIKSTYLTHTDHTAGMHVHVGQGGASFSFGEIQRLASFLFAFEPQLDSLHPRHRINTYYTSAMRKHAMFVPEWHVVHGELPSAFEGLAFLSRAKEPMPLFDAFCLGQGTEAKYSAYNFRGVRSLVKGDNGENAKPTVEFRQHEGTVYGDRVANWICLVVGIAKFLRDVSPKSYLELLKFVQHETWERVYKSRFHSTSLRPAFAQDEFTVIDLLEYMGLDDQAEFYKTRLHQHLYTPPALRTGVSQKTKFTLAGGGEIDIRQAPRLLTQWWYAQDILDPDFITNRKRQEVWEELKKLEIALTKDNPLDSGPGRSLLATPSNPQARL